MRKYGVLVISHGSRDAEWVKRVDEAIAQARLPAGVPVESCFLELVEGRLVQDGISRLERQGVTDVIAVPLFVSSGSTHVNEIAYALGVIPAPSVETDLQPLNIQAQVHLCDPLDDDPEVAAILYDNVAELSVRPEREAVLIIGHGSKVKGFRRLWRDGMDRLARRLQDRGGFGAVETAMLLPEQARRKLALLQRRHPQLDVIVAPLFLSEGYFTKKVIPSRLEGFSYRYSGKSMLPNAYIIKWIERRVATFVQ